MALGLTNYERRFRPHSPLVLLLSVPYKERVFTIGDAPSPYSSNRNRWVWRNIPFLCATSLGDYFVPFPDELVGYVYYNRHLKILLYDTLFA